MPAAPLQFSRQRLIELRGDTPRERLAADAGLSFSAVSAYENGYREPSVRSLVRLAFALGVEIAELLEPAATKAA